MKGSILKHFAVIGMGTIVNLCLGLLTTPIITRIVDPIEYGQLSIFNMYASIALMVLCLGLDQSFVRFFYESNDLSYRKSLLLKCICLPLLITALVSVITISLSVSKVYTFEFETRIITLLCVYTVFQIIYRFGGLIVRLTYKTKLYSILNIMHKLTYIIFALPLIYFVKQEYLLLLVIATVGSVFVCMTISIFSQKEYWRFKKCDLTNIKIRTSDLLRYGAPYIVTLGITTLFQAIDKISLNMYCTYYEVGIYSSTMNLVHVFGIIQTTFNALWTPMAVEHYTKNSEDKTFYIKGNSAITVIMFFCGISLILIKDVFAFLLGSKYREAAYILPFLIFNPIMYTISETTVSGLVFKKKSNIQVFVAIGACLTNIIGNTILVPKLGCQGAAISTGISYIVFYTLRTILSNKYYYIDFNQKRFYFMTGILILYAFYNTFNKFNLISIISAGICYVALFLLYCNTFKWLIPYTIKETKLLFNKKNKNLY